MQDYNKANDLPTRRQWILPGWRYTVSAVQPAFQAIFIVAFGAKDESPTCGRRLGSFRRR